MIKSFLRFLYKRYQKEFDTLSIEETVGKIPAKMEPPSSDFFLRAGAQFEKFLMFEAYLTHRKRMDKPKMGDFYDGWIGHIRFLQKLCTHFKEEPVKMVVPKEEKKEDPMKGITEFVEGMKKKKV